MPRRKQDRPKRMKCEESALGNKASDGQGVVDDDNQSSNKVVKKKKIKRIDKFSNDNELDDDKDFEMEEEEEEEEQDGEGDDDGDSDKDDKEAEVEVEGENEEHDDNDDNEIGNHLIERKCNDVIKEDAESESNEDESCASLQVNKIKISKVSNHSQKCKVESLSEDHATDDLSKLTNTKLTLTTTTATSTLNATHHSSSTQSQKANSSCSIKLKSSSSSPLSSSSPSSSSSLSSSLTATQKSTNVDKLFKSKKLTNDTDEGTPLDFSLKSNNKVCKGHKMKPSSDATKLVPSKDDNSPLDLSLKSFSPRPPSSSSFASSSSLSSKLPFDSNTSWNYSNSRSLSSLKSSSMTQAWNGSKIKSSSNLLSSNNKTSVYSPLSSFSSSSSPSSLISRNTTTGHGRQNPWQTQWMNRSSEQNRDVFTCVWCKNSFRSLQEMTEHMKASPRCGMAGMQQAAALVNSSSSTSISSSAPSLSSSLNVNSSHHSTSLRSSSISPGLNAHSSPPTLSNQNSNTIKEPMSSSVLAKNSMNLPRKLVRGQDVWLGRGAEQTRQILKCMWCGQSFKTLDDMTRHMRETQHYTNIISQEQIISWKTPEDKLAQAQVNAVLTCKVCDESFGSLKELSNHIVRNAHYKEHIIRSMTEGGHGRRRQNRERRKKSLPVRKLLEIERMELVKETRSDKGLDKKIIKEMDNHRNELKHSRNLDTNEDRCKLSPEPNVKSNTANSSMINCDECNERVDAKNFIAHIKICKSLPSAARSQGISEIKSPVSVSATGSRPSSSGPPSRDQTASPEGTGEEGETSENTLDDKREDDGSESSEKQPSSASPMDSGSFLSSIEKLIEKSFDTKSRKNQTTGILQRLGIDEEVCPPWQSLFTSHPSSNHYPGWSSSNKDSYHSHHTAVSPVPSGASSSFIKENGSIGSPSSSCDDSNSSINLLRPSMSLQAPPNSSSLKLSFPISSMIVQNEDNDRKKSSSSPSSPHSGSNSATPCSSRDTPPSHSPFSSDNCKRLKRDSFSEQSEEDEKDPGPKKKKEKCDQQKVKSTRKRNQSGQSADSIEQISNQSLNNIRSALSSSSSNLNSKKREKSGSSFHPLLELQKLLDKTNSETKKLGNSSMPTMISNLVATSASNSVRSFSWALNEATSGSSSSPSSSSTSPLPDTGNGTSVINSHPTSTLSSTHYLKCAFCETQLVSKGAYRHHLSKIHFINTPEKESNSHKESNNINSSSNKVNKSVNEDNGTSNDGQIVVTANSSTSSSQPGPESPHSKFLKYTELAKQLSSKYV